MNRHPAALADFDQVLSLTSNTFEKAYLMKARIYAREGEFALARESIKHYTAKGQSQADPAAQEVLIGVTEAELAGKKAGQAMRAKLWTACEEAASTALQTASHSVGLRQLRADCALAAGNVESAAGDLTCVFLSPYLSFEVRRVLRDLFLQTFDAPNDTIHRAPHEDLPTHLLLLPLLPLHLPRPIHSALNTQAMSPLRPRLCPMSPRPPPRQVLREEL